MGIPPYIMFIEPLLKVLSQHRDGLKVKEAYRLVGEMVGLSDQDKEQLVPSGQQAVYKNRIGWAHDRLKRAGFSTSPRRGFWLLTESGFAFAATNRDGLSDDQVAKIAATNLQMRLRGEDHHGAGEVPEAEEAAILATPDDRLEEAVREIREAVAIDLLENLGRVEPAFFERVVLEVLLSMGYGASKDDLKRVGGSGDGGIDGIISLDKLGLEKVYVQAKRWKGVVGRPEIQGFYGALAGQRARKGVFITTSSFTPQAIEFTRSVEGIVLVDGEKLAQLMIDHGVGVSLRAIQVPRLDSDYFDVE